jgi:hypothetical protein
MSFGLSGSSMVLLYKGLYTCVNLYRVAHGACLTRIDAARLENKPSRTFVLGCRAMRLSRVIIKGVPVRQNLIALLVTLTFVTGPSSLPLFAQAAAGNTSDEAAIRQAISQWDEGKALPRTTDSIFWSGAYKSPLSATRSSKRYPAQISHPRGRPIHNGIRQPSTESKLRSRPT